MKSRFESWTQRLALGASLLWLLSAALSCSKNTDQHSAEPVVAKETRLAEAYPRGTWRLVPFEELDRTVLWVSHIVIAHENSQPTTTKLRSPNWSPDAKPVARRSQGEALALAEKVYNLAAKDPARFETLARTYSDDAVTKERGGSLGGVAAGQLPPQFLDALAVMKPGEVSRVIETGFGFHIIKRNAVPPAVDVAGKRIVIGYRSEGPQPGGSNKRSRAEASVLAQHVAQLARDRSKNFDELIAEYSDDEDKAQGGDLGVWSLRDPRYLPAEVERLGELAVGEVSEPIDSASGFNILLRTPVMTRPRYAMVAVRFEFDPSARDGSPYSKTAAAREAALYAKEINTRPAEFDKILSEHCCEDVVQWTDGRGPVGVTPALDRLRFGQIASVPVLALTNRAYLIPKRVDPSAVAEPLPPRYELPAPKAPDLEVLIGRLIGPVLAQNVRKLRDEVPQTLALAPAQQDALKASVERMATAFEAAPDTKEARLDVWHKGMSNAREVLGPDAFSRFDDAVRAWVTRQLMQGP